MYNFSITVETRIQTPGLTKLDRWDIDVTSRTPVGSLVNEWEVVHNCEVPLDEWMVTNIVILDRIKYSTWKSISLCS